MEKIKITGLLTLVLSLPVVAENGEFYFDSHSLEVKAGGVADIDDVLNGVGQPQGKYHVDLYLNGEFKDTRDVQFKRNKNGQLMPEFTVQNYEDMGVKIRESEVLYSMPGNTIVSHLGDYIPESQVSLDLSQQRLDINVPQFYLQKIARGEVNKQAWDPGILAAILSYNINGMTNRTYGSLQDVHYSNLYANFRPGLNVGAWRLRNDSAYAKNRHYSEWRNFSTYLQRDLQSIQSQMKLGVSNSTSDLFDSVKFKGIQVYSDDGMLPVSMQGFAPIIRGRSISGGLLSVKQNGYVIYQEKVSPGPFMLSDLPTLTPSGELDVTINENDGSENSFSQHYSSVPIMQREGKLKYSSVIGRYLSLSPYSRTPFFAQSSALYGVSNYLTFMGGSQLSENYQSILLGSAGGLGRWGTVSMDLTHATFKPLDDSRHQGQSIRLQYIKDINQSDTTLMLTGYRYATSGFYGFQEANEISPCFDRICTPNYNRRSRVAAQLNQSLQTWGTIFASIYHQDYWNIKGTDKTYSLGYSGNLGSMTLGVIYSKISQNSYKSELLGSAYRQYNTSSRYSGAEDVLSLTLSFPFSRKAQSPYINTMISVNNLGQTLNQSGISGTLNENNVNYSLYYSSGSRGEGSGISGNLDYQATYARLNGGYAHTDNNNMVSYGVSGGVVVHEDGMTLSPDQGDSFTLIRAPGASGVLVDNHTGVKTDWRGYAVITNNSAYRRNTVSLDTASLPNNVALDITSANVVPTRGAVVRADFHPRIGESLLLILRHKSGVVPFGAIARLNSANGEELGTGIVGDNSEVYLNGVPERGDILVSWGKQSEQKCRVELRALEAVSSALDVVTVKRRIVQCV